MEQSLTVARARREYVCVQLTVTLATCLMLGCDSSIDASADTAQREYLANLELSKNGGPIAERMSHLDRCIAALPNAEQCLEARAGLLLNSGRPQDAKIDYDRAVAVADRPYLRYERADALCAVGDPAAALVDLDNAIAAQPDNLQFYPKRALAHLALGKVADARADLQRLSPKPAGSGWAAVLLMEGKPAQAIALLDHQILDPTQHDPSDQALARVLRMLAHAALEQHAQVLGEFDAQRLAAAAHWPEMGYQYWFSPRDCSNAFLFTSARELLSQTQAILQAQSLAAVEPHVNDPATVPPNVVAAASEPIQIIRPPTYWIDRSNDSAVFVELDPFRVDAPTTLPNQLQLLDEHGIRNAERVAVRKECEKNSDEQLTCLTIGEYQYSGAPLAPYASAFAGSVKIVSQPLDRALLSHDAQLRHLAKLFATAPPPPLDATTVYSWQSAASDAGWLEQYTQREEFRPGKYRVNVARTGRRFDDCSLAAFGPLTEFACRNHHTELASIRRDVYLEQRLLGSSEDPALTSLVRYAAIIDGSPSYFAVVERNSAINIERVFRVQDLWRNYFMASARPAD